ncbi:MAG TPA: hypothetical protein VEZ46_14365 [Mycobacteriales bacterium]|nr:hypothetical protein [Mycobacteriales bacterium]
MPAKYDDPRVPQVRGGERVVDVRTAYEQLMDIAREHGRDEIKHLTRAYQAIAPNGGGRVADLVALLG